MTKRTPPCSPEVRGRAVRMVPDHQGEPGRQNAAIRSIAAMIAFIDAQRADPGRRSARARHDDDRRVGSRGVVEENVQAHGVREVRHQLGRAGSRVVRPTIRDRAAPCPRDRVNRPRHPPNARWAADLTAACPRAGKPDPGDNALAETLHGLHKTGVIGRRSLAQRRGRRVRHPRRGRRVQQSPAAGTPRQHAARRGGSPLPGAGRAAIAT
jgi:hypothetical protein